MTENLTTSLTITVAGMGLVFGAIILFWLLTRLLVRLVSDRDVSRRGAKSEEEAATERELRRRAALVGVAVALACQADERPKPFPLPPTALVSTWQAVMRANQLGRRRAVR